MMWINGRVILLKMKVDTEGYGHQHDSCRAADEKWIKTDAVLGGCYYFPFDSAGIQLKEKKPRDEAEPIKPTSKSIPQSRCDGKIRRVLGNSKNLNPSCLWMKQTK